MVSLRQRGRWSGWIALVVLVLIGFSAFADDNPLVAAAEPNVPAGQQVAPVAEPIAVILSSANVLLLLLGACMIFLMQPGFCLVELGHVRAKNSINVISKSLLNFAIAALIFLIGFTFAFGRTQGGWIGLDNFGILWQQGVNSELWLFWLGQFGFAAAALAIPSGAMGERAKLKGMMAFSVIFVGVIYPVIAHWAWASKGTRFGFGGTQGWLEAQRFVDFAGSTMVHGVGGACALAGALVVGPREGRFGHDGMPRLIVGHNLPLTALGTFLLWFGWYGLHIVAKGTVDVSLGLIAVNTTLAPALGIFTALISRWLLDGKPDAGVALNGSLAGLVAISAAADRLSPLFALVIGAVAGLLVTFGAILLEKLRIDDVVSAVPVHLFCGVWGTLAVVLFDHNGLDTFALGRQAIGSCAACFAAFLVALAAFKVVDLVFGLRASQPEQEDGLDFAEHDANAYPDFLTTDQE